MENLKAIKIIVIAKQPPEKGGFLVPKIKFFKKVQALHIKTVHNK